MTTYDQIMAVLTLIYALLIGLDAYGGNKYYFRFESWCKANRGAWVYGLCAFGIVCPVTWTIGGLV